MDSEEAAIDDAYVPRPRVFGHEDGRRHWATVVDETQDTGTENRRKRVLVVDDDTAIRTLLRIYLTRSGLRVDLAVDGADAIEKLRIGDYDAVITDLMMPLMDGVAVVEFMEDERPELLRRTVVLTAYPQMAKDRQLNDKVTVLSKPFDLNGLGTLIDSLSGLPFA